MSEMVSDKRSELTGPEKGLIWIESLQWCANNAAYFLGLIGAATYDLGGSAYLVAGVTLVRNLTTALGNMVAGPVIDAVGPRRVAVATCAASAVLSLGLGLVPVSVASVFFAAVFLGIMGGFINTTTHAYPGYLVRSSAGRQRLNGLLVFYSNIAFTLGPVIGGVLVGRFATTSVYLFMAPLMAVGALIALGCRETYLPERDEEGASGGVVSSLFDGLRLTFASPLLRVVFLSGFLGFFAFGAFDSLESLFYRDVLRVDISWMGWLSAASGVTLALGAWLVTKLPARSANLGLLLGSLLLVGVGSMVYVGTDILTVAILGQAINGLAWGVLEPVQMILVQEATPIAELGRVTGFVRFGHMLAGVVPLLVAPFLADALGVQAVLFGAAIVIAGVGLAFFARWRLVWSRGKAKGLS